MTFKDFVTLTFSRQNEEAKSLIKMLKTEEQKVHSFISNIKKITFNEVFISCSKILLISFGLIVGFFGVYLSVSSLFTLNEAAVSFRALTLLLVLVVSVMATFLSAISIRMAVLKIKLQLRDHINVRGYTKNIKNEYVEFNNKVLNHLEEQSKIAPGLNQDLMFIESEVYEDKLNELTSKMLKGLVGVDSKKYIRFYIYDRSHITNRYTQVLYIHASTLTIYSHFLHNSNILEIKDLLDISFKMYLHK